MFLVLHCFFLKLRYTWHTNCISFKCITSFYIYIYVYVYICIYICICICICICIYTHTHTRGFSDGSVVKNPSANAGDGG